MDKPVSEIIKLTDRIAKDPKSKLFVSLAEEYKKAGDIEMAIHVLSEGLKINSGYVTARSVLGKLLFEHGNLEGSRKEFEEVVKAIPDNLMAHRKLGDIYVLQKKPDDALQHYKIIYSANPRDEELASLIAELEAGHDISTRIHTTGPKPTAEPTVKPETPTSAVVKAPPQGQALQKSTTTETQAMDEAALGTVRPAAVGKEQSVLNTIQVTDKTPGSLVDETTPVAYDHQVQEDERVPEEVLFVEPLDDSEAGAEIPGPEFDFLAEKSHDSAPATLQEAPGEASFAAGDAMAQKESVLDDIFVVPTQIDAVEAQEKPVADDVTLVAAESTDAGTLADEKDLGSLLAEMPGKPPEELSEVIFADTPGTIDENAVGPVAVEADEQGIVEFSDAFFADAPEQSAAHIPESGAAGTVEEPVIDQSDDFTTDTLAELYISQGFYEKAIDIYQRMLADKPESKGLKDKLERVKAMAGETAAEYGEGENVVVGTYEPTASKGLSAWDADANPVELNGFTEAREYVPPVEAGDTGPASGIFADLEEIKGADSSLADAREYRPIIEELPVVGNESAEDLILPQAFKGHASASPLSSDFVPREYIMPKKEIESGESSEKAPAVPSPLKKDKQETIDKLETWLKRMQKEI